MIATIKEVFSKGNKALCNLFSFFLRLMKKLVDEYHDQLVELKCKLHRPEAIH